MLEPYLADCVILNLNITKLSLIATLAVDTILLFIMFIGLLRRRLHEHSAFGLGHFLWRQVGWLLAVLTGRGVFYPLKCCSLSTGSHLALGCHHCRDPASGK